GLLRGPRGLRGAGGGGGAGRGGARPGGRPAPPLRVIAEPRTTSRRRSETSLGVLAAVVADVEARVQESSRQVRAIEEELRGAPGPLPGRLRQRLRQLRETQVGLRRRLEALKVIARSADVRITIPARRGPRRS